MKARNALSLVLLTGLVLGYLPDGRAEVRTYRNPTYQGYRLAYCQGFGQVCGERVATQWCRDQGFEYASDWAIDRDIGDVQPTMRMDDDAAIVLDPVNREVIDQALQAGVKKYIGGNCTVSLLLMALAGLFRTNLVEWLVSMTYQAASGAGAGCLRELVAQISAIGSGAAAVLDDPSSSPLELDKKVLEIMHDDSFPVQQTTAPLAGSLLAWIDRDLGNGQSREEWKGTVETNKILQTPATIPVDGICVRIGSMRCHSQAVTVKLTVAMFEFAVPSLTLKVKLSGPK